MAIPADDLAAKLAALGHGTVGSSIFIGDELPVSSAVPETAVFVRVTGGPPSNDTFRRLHGVRWPTVQVLVRAPAHDYQAGQTKANSIFTTAHGAAISGYSECKAMSSGPIYIGKDSQDRPKFSINFMLGYVY
jgi:Bacteriophage minor capsid protein